MYIIFLNKLRLHQISCSGRGGTHWQYGVPKWYEMVNRFGTPYQGRTQGGVGAKTPPWAWYFTKNLLPSQGD